MGKIELWICEVFLTYAERETITDYAKVPSWEFLNLFSSMNKNTLYLILLVLKWLYVILFVS